MATAFFIVRYVATNGHDVPFGVVVFSESEVHWRFREDTEFVSDPEDLEVVSGTSEIFSNLAQSLGPREFVAWLSNSFNLALQLQGPYPVSVDSAENLESVVNALFAEHVQSKWTGCV